MCAADESIAVRQFILYERLGPTRRARLLKEHGSVKRLRGLTVEELVAIPWLPEKVGRAVYAQLHGDVSGVAASRVSRLATERGLSGPAPSAESGKQA